MKHQGTRPAHLHADQKPLLALPSYSLRQLATRWGCEEDDVADYIRTDVLTAHVLLNRVWVTCSNLRDQTDKFEKILDGHYRLPTKSAVLLLDGPKGFHDRGALILVAEEPDFLVAVIGARGHAPGFFDVPNLAGRKNLRVLREEVERVDGIGAQRAPETTAVGPAAAGPNTALPPSGTVDPPTRSAEGEQQFRRDGDVRTGVSVRKIVVRPVTLLPGTTWSEIALRVLDDQTVEIRAKGKRETRTFAEAGMRDNRRNEGEPNMAWGLLLVLAKNGGSLGWGDAHASDKARTHLKLLRRHLRALFQIVEDPILDYRRERCWRTKFSLTDARPQE